MHKAALGLSIGHPIILRIMMLYFRGLKILHEHNFLCANITFTASPALQPVPVAPQGVIALYRECQALLDQ